MISSATASTCTTETHMSVRRAWIPAEELDDFNDRIGSLIEVIAEYRGQPAQRIR